MSTTSGRSRPTTSTASSACAKNLRSSSGTSYSRARRISTSSKTRTFIAARPASSELRRREHVLQERVDLGHHAASRLRIDRLQRRLDLVQVLQLRKELDVGERLARREQLANDLQLAQQIVEPDL